MDMTFKFKIDLAEYAKRFGISLPDDSSDVITDDGEKVEKDGDGGEGGSDAKDCACCDSVVAEDAATVSYAPGFAPGSLAGQCQATLAQCKAKNPMTCRYHGAQVIANDIEASLRAAGITAPVDVQLLGVSSSGGKQYLSVQATLKGSENDKAAIEAAMKAFFQNPGVEGDTDVMGFTGTHYESPFDIDMLDPGAKAKWGAGQSAPQPTAQQPAAPAPQAAPIPQTQQPPAPAAMPVSKRPRPTRKRVKKSDPTTEETQTTTAEVDPTVAASPNLEGVEVELDPDAPTLYPDQAPPKPPDWTPPFDANELATLAGYAERIGKTAERLDGVLDKDAAQPGYLAQYLAKGNGKQGLPNANLPKGLQTWKNTVDVNALRALAAKDTDGQVKKMLDAAEKIEASEQNGWKDKIGVTKSDVTFDPTKYVDPYAKERAAYEAYVPGDKGRDAGLGAASQVEKAKGKDAPKKAAEDAKAAAKEMDDLEKDFKALSDAPKPVLKLLAQAYHRANERFKDGVAKCKKWLSSLSIMQANVKDTADAFRQRNGRDATYLVNGLEHNLKVKRKDAIDICKQNSAVFAADPEGCTAMFEKNAKFMFENGSLRIAVPFAAVETLLADPESPAVHSGFKNGCYRPRSIDSDYVRIANHNFGTTASDFMGIEGKRNIHKYGALFEKKSGHSGDLRSRGYGDIEIELDIKKCLAFWGGCHSQTRYTMQSLPSANASLITDPKITMAPYLYHQGANLDELFTTDFSKVKNGWRKVYNILSCGGHSARKGAAIPELWFGDEVTRDMTIGIHPYSLNIINKIKSINPQFVQDNNIDIS